MKVKEYLKKNRKGCFRHDRDERMYYEKYVIKLMENYAKLLTIPVVVVPKGTFYCNNRQNDYKDTICKEQCDICRWQTEAKQ